MSRFSKRAKFLSILTAVSAVGKAGAGAVTIPDHKYIPASVEAQNAVKFEKDLGLNASRNSLQVVKGPRFSIESAAVGAVGAAALGTAGLLVKNLFFNERRDAVNLLIGLLKENKVNFLSFNISNATTRFNFDGSDLLFIQNSEKINKIKNPEEKNKVGALMLRKFNMGMSEIEFSLPTSPRVFGITVYAGNDGKIHVVSDRFGGDFAAEDFEKKVEETKKKYNIHVDLIKKDAEVIRDILNSRLVKEVLGEALKNKSYCDPSKIPAQNPNNPMGNGPSMNPNNPIGGFGSGVSSPSMNSNIMNPMGGFSSGMGDPSINFQNPNNLIGGPGSGSVPSMDPNAI